MITRNYVCGFLVDEAWDQVVLVKKLRPTWQAGKLNGVGGKIETIIGEKVESPLDAMIREFKEETGNVVVNWTYYCQLAGGTSPIQPEWKVDFFYSTELMRLNNPITLPIDIKDPNAEVCSFYDMNVVLRHSATFARNTLWALIMAKEHAEGKCTVVYNVHEQRW